MSLLYTLGSSLYDVQLLGTGLRHPIILTGNYTNFTLGAFTGVAQYAGRVNIDNNNIDNSDNNIIDNNNNNIDNNNNNNIDNCNNDY